MKRKKVESKTESQILIGMIVSKPFLTQIAPVIEFAFFKTDMHRTVAKWCIQYFNQYQDCPDKRIENIFHGWVENKKPDPEIVSSVEAFLSHLSEKHDTEKDINVPYLLDETAKWVTLRKMELLKDEIEYAITNGSIEEAENAIVNYSTLSLSEGNGIDLLHDKAAWEAAYSEAQKPLIRFANDDVDRFLARPMTRDALIGILAPEKRGKTWWCIELAIRGLRNRKRVAFFEVGDMSQSQILKRFGCYFSKRPSIRALCGDVRVPVHIERHDKQPFVGYETMACKSPITLKSSLESVARFAASQGIGENYLRLSTHANSSVSVADINGILQRWGQEYEFVPDIIVIDYPDILAPEPGTQSNLPRDQINATWKALRRLSQEKHCLVIVPTQANAAAHQSTTLDVSNFAEDKRKFAHVTGMLGLNQNDEEKDAGIMRLNWVILREGSFSPKRCLYVAQCLAVGRPMVCACL
jgi:hypothetical protein